MNLKTILIITVFFLTSCALIFNGPKQKIQLITTPEQASYTLDDKHFGTTPAELELKRKLSHSLKLEKEGYKTEYRIINHKTSFWFWGNLGLVPVFGLGGVGMLTDFLTGAMYTLGEDTLKVNMTGFSGNSRESGHSMVKVAVLEMSSYGVDAHVSQLLTEKMRSNLFSSGKFVVMNREDMNRVMTEQDFQKSENCDSENCLVEMGKILGVTKVITGSIGRLGKTYSLTVKLIDVATSKNEKIININKKCREEDLFNLINAAADELAAMVN